jgi:hypothetical protein
MAGRQLGVVAVVGLGGRDVADRLEQAAGIEPVDPLEDGDLSRLRRGLSR